VRFACAGFALITAGCDSLFNIDMVTPVDAPPDADLSSGCSDGTREGFIDLAAFPSIAGCSGAWTLGGVKEVVDPACERAAGNEGSNFRGTGCNVADLCAPGWGVCKDKVAVAASSSATACADVTTAPDMFFATGQSGSGGSGCDVSGVNDIFGCGTMGLLAAPSCLPLLRTGQNDCFELRSHPGGWTCSSPDEAKNVTKSDPLFGGGVLCCRD
jgi:hypothetical protein